MTQIHCDRKHCLNNDKHGICTAKTIEYNGRCQHMVVQVKIYVVYVLDHMAS